MMTAPFPRFRVRQFNTAGASSWFVEENIFFGLLPIYWPLRFYFTKEDADWAVSHAAEYPIMEAAYDQG